MLEPYPIYLADRTAKALARAIPAFRQVTTQRISEEYGGDIGEVFFAMHGYRTRATKARSSWLQSNQKRKLFERSSACWRKASCHARSLAWPRSGAGRRGAAAHGQRGRYWIRSPIPSTLAASVRPTGRGQERTNRFWIRDCSTAALPQSLRAEPVPPGAVFAANGHHSQARCAVLVAARRWAFA
jgi:hypothetical protein